MTDKAQDQEYRKKYGIPPLTRPTNESAGVFKAQVQGEWQVKALEDIWVDTLYDYQNDKLTRFEVARRFAEAISPHTTEASVKRYDICFDGRHSCDGYHENEYGEWVKFEDLRTLPATREAEAVKLLKEHYDNITTAGWNWKQWSYKVARFLETTGSDTQGGVK